MLKSVKKEDLVVGSKTNFFALEEMKKATDRNFKFSTNKIKTEMELENLKTGREGLKLGEYSSNSVLEGLQERIIMRGLQAGKLLKDGLLESAIPYEGLEEHDLLREGLEEGSMHNEGLEKNKILNEVLEVTSSEAKVDDNQEIQSSLEAIRKEKFEIEAALTTLKSINLKIEELKVEQDELEYLKSEVVKAKKGEVTRKIKLSAVVVEALIDPRGKMRKYTGCFF